MKNQMTRLFFGAILMFFTYNSVAQIEENLWQPDSIYANRKVKTIRIYKITRNNINEKVEFNEFGKRTRVEKYDYSFYYRNGNIRHKKYIEETSYYYYNIEGKLLRIVHLAIDSVKKSSNKFTSFEYDSTGLLYKKQFFIGESKKPYSETMYFYNPYKIISTSKDDSIFTFHAIEEFDKDFYLNHYDGWQIQQKWKRKGFNHSDSSYLVKIGLESVINNTFDSSGKLIYSYYRLVWREDDKITDRNEFRYNYHYYKNGLLKRIGGSLDLYYKYEYYE